MPTEHFSATVLGATIRAARLRARLTAAALAKRLEVSRPHLCDLEYGRRNPSPALLDQIEREIGLKPGALARLDPRPPVAEIVSLCRADPELAHQLRRAIARGALTAARVRDLR